MMTNTTHGLWVAMLGFFVAACSGAAHGGQDGGGTGSDGSFAFDGSLSSCPQGNEAIQAAILVPRCGSCHGASTPFAGLDLVSPGIGTRLANAPASTCPGQILLVPGNANGSFVYHKVADAHPACGTQMPPTGAIPAAEVACLEAWINAGLQPTPDGGVITPVDAGPPWMAVPGSTPACDPNGPTGPDMCPGSDCSSSACHAPGGSASDRNQLWTIAGTVFGSPTAAVTAGLANASVTITDSAGLTFAVQTNRVGNFYTTRAVTFPLMAVVASGTLTHSMPLPVPTGSCNSCHTLPSVNGTFGRIYVN